MAIDNYYETERALGEYLLLHYGGREEVLPYAFGPAEALEFPARCVAECLERSRLPAEARALDLGCAVGRSSFELARYCAEVIGVDYSRAFIESARRLQCEGALGFSYVEEGGLALNAVARVPAGIDRQRVAFEAGDAQELRAGLGTFDVVLMANLIDRLREPRRCLKQMPRLVRRGGQLILTSPCTWLEEFTPREQWLGGFERGGRRIKTIDTLNEVLGPAFELIARKDMPLLIREHARKFQWSVAEATVWGRR
jgi:putative 4-mercaptohistidine N1-methyltranferase